MEWNGRPLANKRYDEVRQIVSDSYLEPQVELRVARVLTNPPTAGLGTGPPGAAGAVGARSNAVVPGQPVAAHAPQQPVDLLGQGPAMMGTRIQVGRSGLVLRVDVRGETRAKRTTTTVSENAL